VRRLRRALGAVVVLALIVFFGVGAVVERFLNRLEPVPLPAVSDAARALHAASLVADMHADSLLAGRDLVRRSHVGHVDLPRLQEGGVGLQFFTAATVVPFGLNIERNESDAFDLLTLLGMAQLSPFAWRGPLGRAELQADRALRERWSPCARAPIWRPCSRGGHRAEGRSARCSESKAHTRSRATSRTSTSSSRAAFA